MATITAINSPKGQCHASMKAVMQYAVQQIKTEYEGLVLADGVNCVPDSNCIAYDEFVNTKRQFGKDDGRMYFHFVLSHSPDEDVKPKKAHEMAMEFAKKYFKNYETLVATHTDRDHIHSHLIVNSVSFVNGKKYNSGPGEIKEMHELNDRLCEKYGFNVCEKYDFEISHGIKQSEYHSAMRNESWKQDLRNVIDNAMSHSTGKNGFIEILRSEGYGVTWTESRKNITYTCPNGKKCRDKNLGNDKYLKYFMDAEMSIRRNVFYDEEDFEFPETIDTGWENERLYLFQLIMKSDKVGEDVKAQTLNLAYNLTKIFENYAAERFDYQADDGDIDKELRREIKAVKDGMNYSL